MNTPAKSQPVPVAELRPVTALRGVGDALAQKLQKLGVSTIQDLLFLLPLRYEDRTQVVPIGALQIGDRSVVEGEVQLAEVAFRGRRQLLCRIADGSGSLTLRFFYFSSGSSRRWRAACAFAVTAKFDGGQADWRSCTRSTGAWQAMALTASKQR